MLAAQAHPHDYLTSNESAQRRTPRGCQAGLRAGGIQRLEAASLGGSVVFVLFVVLLALFVFALFVLVVVFASAVVVFVSIFAGH